MAKIQVEAVKRIEEGKHIGKIVEIQYRETPFAYTDVVIQLKNGAKLKAGFPLK